MKIVKALSVVVASIAFLVFLLFIPMIKNTIHLMIFARQLAKVDDVLDGYRELIATGSDVYVSGNTEACSFRAVRVYKYYATGEEQKIIEDIKSLTFSSAKHVEYYEKVETYVEYVDRILVVRIHDYGHSAWLDFRCW